jgi:hypothetical protein
MKDSTHFRYIDLDSMCEKNTISDFFGNWTENEVLLVLSPHDDDAMLGAGYAMTAALAHGAEVYIIIFHSGNAGYSDPSMRDSIVKIRKKETVDAYGLMGIPEDHIIRLEIPDFSGGNYLGWYKPYPTGDDNSKTAFATLLKMLRKLKVTRLFFANGYREHIDHTAVADSGIFYGPQVGDPVLGDWESPHMIHSFYQYSVWGQLDPIESIRRNAPQDALAGNRAIVVDPTIEEQIRTALQAFTSQQQIIAGIVKVREERKTTFGYLEPYIALDPRPQFDYAPYRTRIEEILQQKDH